MFIKSCFKTRFHRLLSTHNTTVKKLTAMELQHMYRKSLSSYRFECLALLLSEQKLTMITAYDFPSVKWRYKSTALPLQGLHAEHAGFDIVLVGDSLGMVVLGYVYAAYMHTVYIFMCTCNVVRYDTTQPVTMEEMIHHCKATRRGATSRFIVGDMPFGSYEDGPHEALVNARRLVKEV